MGPPVIGLSHNWCNALDLGARAAPELFTSASEIPPSKHSDIINLAFDQLDINAVFCVEGVPTVAIIERTSSLNVDELHRILWNQGVLSVLLVLDQTTATAYSLTETPRLTDDSDSTVGDTRLVEILDQTADAFRLSELFRSIESGRYWMENDRQFRVESRVDQVLLSNLEFSFKELAPQLGGAGSQALLMQAMFVAYVEDRGMVSSSPFLEASDGEAASFLELLELGRPDDLERLFMCLKALFNGGLFLDPVTLGELAAAQRPSPAAMEVLARFRRGAEAMSTGQYRFWAYDFRYIPIALISAVYDRFLGNEIALRKKHGAFYTPAFLVDVVVDQLWENLTSRQRAIGTFMDPACGSGIFLVRLFQRLVAHQKATSEVVSWSTLVSIAERLYGADIDPSAVRISAFSLYIALLEQMDPREIVELTRQGHLLPKLLDKTLLAGRDFLTSPAIVVDALLGNPPWKGRPGGLAAEADENKTKSKDVNDHADDPAPSKDIAWRFVWQALRCVRPNGLIALLLPAMGLLHNPSSAIARAQLFAQARILRVINFSDLVFELFDGADRPTCLLLLSPDRGGDGVYTFDYWVPKADPSLRLKRMIVLPHSDRLRLRSASVAKDAGLLKRRLWTRSPDERLFGYLQTFPSLGERIGQFKNAEVSESDTSLRPHWTIGQGFKFAKKPDERPEGYDVQVEPRIGDYPFYPAKHFRALALNYKKLAAPANTEVHRVGFVASFEGPHILIPQGIIRGEGRLRAAFGTKSVSFNSSLQAITVPPDEQDKAKLLTAVLNSRLAAWFFFHNSAYMGADRAKVLQGQLLQLPFDDPENMPDPIMATDAARRLADIVDSEITHASKSGEHSPQEVWSELDREVFRYYGLDEADVAIVDDSFEFIIPAMQPRLDRSPPKLWEKPTFEERKRYALTLCRSLSGWLRGGVHACLEAASDDFTLLRLTFSDTSGEAYSERNSGLLRDAISRIGGAIALEASRNLQLVPDLRVASGDNLFLLKPNRRRDWLASAAEADAGDIAADLHGSPVHSQVSSQ